MSDRRVAIIGWTHLLEDYLEDISTSFDAIVDGMGGGWMFGYCDALRSAGIGTTLYFFSEQVDGPVQRTHRATGASIVVLPAARAYRVVRRYLPNPYAYDFSATGSVARGLGGLRDRVLWSLAPYLSTPVRRLARQLRGRYDAVMCQDYEHGRFDQCVLIGRGLRLPVFATFQGGDTPLSPIEPLVRRFTVRACAGLVVGSQRERERVLGSYGLPVSKVAAIFNPLDASGWSPVDRTEARSHLGLSPEARVVAWHGRVQVRIKGLDVLLEAWRMLCERWPQRELCLLLAGSGNDADELRGRIDALALPSIRWLDEYVTDRDVLVRHLSAADVYVLASRREGFPVAPLEAMACGLPVIAADVAGIRDVLPEGEASGGIVVPVDDAAALAGALGRLIDDLPLARVLGTAARANVERRFSSSAVGRDLRDFLFPAPGG